VGSLVPHPPRDGRGEGLGEGRAGQGRGR
jgi:hypothetical protein